MTGELIVTSATSRKLNVKLQQLNKLIKEAVENQEKYDLQGYQVDENIYFYINGVLANQQFVNQDKLFDILISFIHFFILYFYNGTII